MKTFEGHAAIESSVPQPVTGVCPEDALYVTVLLTVVQGDPGQPHLLVAVTVGLGAGGQLSVLAVPQDLRRPHLPLPQLLLLVRKTLTLEPGDAHHPHHGAHDDGPDTEESKLCGSVALVLGAVVRAVLSLRPECRGE